MQDDNSRRIDPDGTVHLGPLAIPVPKTVSPEAQKYLATSPLLGPPPAEPAPMWESRPQVDAMMHLMSKHAAQRYPVTIEDVPIANVRTQIVRSQGAAPPHKDQILINLHGGGFVMGGGALIEAIPVAAATRLPVVAVDYRLAPEHPFPAAVDDAVAVYRALLETHDAKDIVIYGASAGAILTAQTIVRLHREGLPLPACIGLFTGAGDLVDFGDTSRIFTLLGFWGTPMLPTDHPLSEIRAYLGGHDPEDPAVSPMRGDLSYFPPSLLIAGTRDGLLSATTNFHRALRRAGVEADLFVFDAMPHAHWYAFHLPEAEEAVDIMARFFAKHLNT